MKYAFIRAHRAELGVRAMCRVLRVHFSGFYAWLKEPLSHRAQEDVRQTELTRQAWSDSGKVCGYRKLTDDLRDQGEQISENRVARLASLAGIAAQVGYGRRQVALIKLLFKTEIFKCRCLGEAFRKGLWR